MSDRTDWAHGAAGAVRAARIAVESEPELRLSLDDLDAILAGFTAVHSEAVQELREEVAHLKTALLSRAVIEQAKGILMVQSHLTSEDAFKLLVRASQRENMKLREVARRIVERASRQSP